MKFQRFYEDELQMRGYFENFQDNARTNPQIPASHIGRSIIYIPSLRLKSILELDQRARFAYFRNLIGSKRPMVTSDSTVQVVSLGAFPLSSQPYKTKGKELPASRELLSRLIKHLGKSWCDILGVDGLYMTRQDFQEAKETGTLWVGYPILSKLHG